ncbi:putative octicosapeptide/Phox/Bem1p family protein [Tanacetum coccineum]
MTSTNTIKFLCSFGGKILPRYPDGNLRYHGGQTRLLSVNRSISFNELMTKLGELCETTVCLRCQLPTEDLDALVSITCDEDLNNLIEEYDRYAAQQSKSIKIRAFLSLPKRSTLSGSPSSSVVGSCSSGSSTATQEAGSPKSANRCVYRVAKQPVYLPVRYGAGSMIVTK